MNIDRPKRRAETMVGVVVVDNNELLPQRIKRWCRAVDQVEKEFDLKVCKNGFGDSIHRLPITITAIIHREPLESRWARALDMIREQYGLDIEWERGEVTERTNYNKFVDAFVGHIAKVHGLPREVLGKVTQSESFGPLNCEDGGTIRAVGVSDDPTGHCSGTLIISDEVSDEVPTPEQIAKMRQGAEQASKAGGAWNKMARDTLRKIGIGNSKHDLECRLNEIPGVEKVVIVEKPGEFFVRVHAPGCYDIRPDVDAVMTDMMPCGIPWDFEIDNVGQADAPWCGKAKLAPPLRSYADTPTGTVEWTESDGEHVKTMISLHGDHKAPFAQALHLVDLETGCGDFDVCCPVCGDYEMTDYYLFADHVSKLFGLEAGGDRDAIEKLEAGVTCNACHHHLTYDFDQETVTIGRGE